MVSAAVYEEVAVKGKQELYEAAFEWEKILEDEASVVRSRPESRAERLLG